MGKEEYTQKETLQVSVSELKDLQKEGFAVEVSAWPRYAYNRELGTITMNFDVRYWENMQDDDEIIDINSKEEDVSINRKTLKYYTLNLKEIFPNSTLQERDYVYLCSIVNQTTFLELMKKQNKSFIDKALSVFEEKKSINSIFLDLQESVTKVLFYSLQSSKSTFIESIRWSYSDIEKLIDNPDFVFNLANFYNSFRSLIVISAQKISKENDIATLDLNLIDQLTQLANKYKMFRFVNKLKTNDNLLISTISNELNLGLTFLKGLGLEGTVKPSAYSNGSSIAVLGSKSEKTNSIPHDPKPGRCAYFTTAVYTSLDNFLKYFERKHLGLYREH